MNQTIALFLTLALPSIGLCQERPAAATENFYRLQFVVKEVEAAKVINSRQFNTVISSEKGMSAIRTGNQISVELEPGKLSSLEVGVNIDCRNARELAGQLVMRVDANITSLVPQQPQQTYRQPLVRRNQWSADVTIPVGKATNLFSSDDPANIRQMQLEVTVTPMK